MVRIGEDPEGVHQARVATRRLRSHLRTFRKLLEPEWAEPLRDELGWLGDELGGVRDADVLLDRLKSRIAALDDDDRVAAGAAGQSADRRPRSRAAPSCSTGCAATATSSSSTVWSTPRTDRVSS